MNSSVSDWACKKQNIWLAGMTGVFLIGALSLAEASESVTLSIGNPIPLPEGDLGSKNMIFIVTRDGDLAPSLTVQFTTQDGTAIAGINYKATSGTLNFAAFQTTATIVVPIIGNTVLQSNRNFTVILSNPLTGAKLAERHEFTGAPNVRCVVLGDINGDGRPDLVTANIKSDTVSVLLNTTEAGGLTPAFAPQQVYATGSAPVFVEMEDINGDGRLDLVVANANENNVSVLLNTTVPKAATSSFATQKVFQVGFYYSEYLEKYLKGAAYPRSIAFGDFNSDGRPDMAVVNSYPNTMSVLLNTTVKGSATPSFTTYKSYATERTPSSVKVGDINGDGRPDIAVANEWVDTVSVYLNTMTKDSLTPSFDSQVTFATKPHPESTGGHPIALVMGDLNGDGRPDLAVANWKVGTVAVLLNTTTEGATTPSFATQKAFQMIITNGQSLAIGDLNGDGRLDLAMVSGGIWVLLNTMTKGATTPSFTEPKPFPINIFSTFVALGDVNSDGLLDLAVANGNNDKASILLNLTPVITMTNDTATGTIQDDDSPPSANSQTLETAFNTPIGITLTASDANNDPLTFSVVTGPSHGALSGTEPNLTYTPNAGYVGEDAFTFKAHDGTADSNLATISITIKGAANQSPVAGSKSVTTAEDTAKVITLSATDGDGDILTFAVISAPTQGTLSGTAPNLTYTPAANYNGSDSFTFRANDGKANSNVATVSIAVTAVNDNPVIATSFAANPNPANISETVTFSAGATDVDGDALSYTWNFGDGTSGSGTTPSHTYSSVGSYTVNLTVTDGNGGAASAVLDLVVNDGDAPTLKVNSVLLKGTVTDASGIASLTVNGATATVASNGMWQHEVTLISASTTVIIKVVDGSGNETTRTVTVGK